MVNPQIYVCTLYNCTIVQIYLYVCVLSSSICVTPLREPTSVDVLDNDAHLEKKGCFIL